MKYRIERVGGPATGGCFLVWSQAQGRDTDVSLAHYAVRSELPVLTYRCPEFVKTSAKPYTPSQEEAEEAMMELIARHGATPHLALNWPMYMRAELGQALETLPEDKRARAFEVSMERWEAMRVRAEETRMEEYAASLARNEAMRLAEERALDEMRRKALSRRASRSLGRGQRGFSPYGI